MVITFIPSEHVRFIRQLSKTRLYCQSETGPVRVVRDEEWLSWRQALFFNWPDPSDDIDAPTDHLEPLSGSALDRELRTLFGTDAEAEGRSTASTTTGQYVDAGEPTITAAGAPSTAAAAPDRSLPVERPAKRTKCSHEGAASVGHPRSSGYPLDHATYVGAYFRFGMLHAKGFVHKVYTGPPDQDPPSKQIDRRLLQVDFRKTYKVTAVYESKKWHAFHFEVKHGNDKYKVWANARKCVTFWVCGVRGPPENDDEVSSDEEI